MGTCLFTTTPGTSHVKCHSFWSHVKEKRTPGSGWYEGFQTRGSVFPFITLNKTAASPASTAWMSSSGELPNLPLATVAMFVFIESDGVRMLQWTWLAVRTSDQALWLASLSSDIHVFWTGWWDLRTGSDVSQSVSDFFWLLFWPNKIKNMGVRCNNIKYSCIIHRGLKEHWRVQFAGLLSLSTENRLLIGLSVYLSGLYLLSSSAVLIIMDKVAALLMIPLFSSLILQISTSAHTRWDATPPCVVVTEQRMISHKVCMDSSLKIHCRVIYCKFWGMIVLLRLLVLMFVATLNSARCLCRASYLPSSVSRRWGNFHHIILNSYNTTVPRYNNTGSEHPPKWSVPRGPRGGQHDRRIGDCQTNRREQEKVFIFVSERDIYIFMFLYISFNILYIRLFSYWKTLYSHATPPSLHHGQRNSCWCLHFLRREISVRRFLLCEDQSGDLQSAVGFLSVQHFMSRPS